MRPVLQSSCKQKCNKSTVWNEKLEHSFWWPFLFYSLVPAVFWWGNFDKNVDTSVGGGSTQITPGTAFQEVVSEAEYQKETVTIPRSKRHSIILPSDPDPSLAIKINPQKKSCKIYNITWTSLFWSIRKLHATTCSIETFEIWCFK